MTFNNKNSHCALLGISDGHYVDNKTGNDTWRKEDSKVNSFPPDMMSNTYEHIQDQLLRNLTQYSEARFQN